MADKPEELLLDEHMELPSGTDGASADTDDVSIEIEGDEPDETPLVKRLRQEVVDTKRQLSDARREQQAGNAPPEPGPRPTIEGVDYDQDRFDAALDTWDAKREAKREWDRNQAEAEKARNHAFERTVSNYRGRAAQLGVKDFAEVEQLVVSKVPELLRNAVLQYAKDPAKVMYALGKHPAHLDRLIAEGDPNAGGDPVRFILGIADLEREIKVKVINKRKPPEPEAATIQRGSAPLSGQNTDKQREKLLTEARTTGDRTKLQAFDRAQREKESRK